VTLRSYGSQGQQRVALLALLFAERELLLERRGQAPLMLLDDVMSELDATRRELLAELLRSGGQSLVTTTERGHVPGADGMSVEVEGGRIHGPSGALAA
jgi:DNA replication and repair protein RecF